MERSFARAKRYGFDKARWRRLWRVRIQEYMTAAIQNIQILIKHGKDPTIQVAISMVQTVKKLEIYTKPVRLLESVLLKIARDGAIPKLFCTVKV